MWKFCFSKGFPNSVSYFEHLPDHWNASDLDAFASSRLTCSQRDLFFQEVWKVKNLRENYLPLLSWVFLRSESLVIWDSSNHCCFHLIRTLLWCSRTMSGCRILWFWKTESRTPRGYHRGFWWQPAAVATPSVLISCLNTKWFPLGRFTPSFLFICVLRFPSLTLSEYTNHLMSWRLYCST